MAQSLTTAVPKKHAVVRGSHRTFARAGYLIILVGVVLTGSVAAFANVASAVFATGIVAVESSRKVVQHLEGGIVQEILVKEAEQVQSGQILVRLDATRANATVQLYRAQLLAMMGTQGRLEAEQVERDSITFPEYIMGLSDDPLAARVMDDESKIFAQGSASLANQIAILEGRSAELSQRAAGWKTQIEQLNKQIASFTDERSGLSGLANNGLYSANDLRTFDRQIASLTGGLGEATAELAGSNSSIAEALLQIDQLRQDYRRGAADKLAALRPQITDLRERLTVAEDVRNRLDIRAPQTGIVQNLRIHTIGGVVGAGEAILEIVPTGDDLVINAQVATTDVDSVTAEMTAEVKFTAFHSRHMPILLGSVTSVSADAITDPQTNRSYFLVKVQVDPETIPAEFRGKLQPGMPAEVVLSTGDRTILDYLTRPLSDAMNRGMREP